MTKAAQAPVPVEDLFRGLKEHFQGAAERHPYWRRNFESLAEVIEVFEKEPGKFAVAPDGTFDSTYKRSDKNMAAYEAWNALFYTQRRAREMKNTYHRSAYRAYTDEEAHKASLDRFQEALKSPMLVHAPEIYAEFEAVSDKFQAIEAFFDAIPSQEEKKHRALKEAKRELASALQGAAAPVAPPAPAVRPRATPVPQKSVIKPLK